MDARHPSPSPGTRTPASVSSDTQTSNHSSHNPSMSGSMISTVWSGFMRHFSTSDMADVSQSSDTGKLQPALAHAYTEPPAPKDGINDVFVPSTMKRTASPFRPPPLDPVVLHGFKDNTPPSARLLTQSIAEEIRIMLPERLRIMEDWDLVYSLEQDGASLATLYQKAASVHARRIGFVLVVRDEVGGTFGAYLSEYPRPATGYFGNGECFLWRASLLAGLPPPPSADTSNMNVGRTSTISRSNRSSAAAAIAKAPSPPDLLGDTPTSPNLIVTDESPNSMGPGRDSIVHGRRLTPSPAPSESIRFKAFPYSGVNDYYINCETGFLSMGAGDGHYGLWLDSSLDRGRSGRSHTFGNEPLSDEGEKFGILGVELWVLGA